MAKDVDLTSQEWLNLVFEGKNKEYGAYVLRDSSSDRHIKALAIVVIAGMAFIFLPRLVKSVVPQHPTSSGEPGVVVMITPPVTTEPVQAVPEVKVIPPVLTIKTIAFPPPKVVPDDRINPDNLTPTQANLTDNPDAVIADVNNPNGVVGKGVIPTVEQIEPPKGPTIFTHVEIAPAYPGGEKEMMKWLSANIIYPVPAIEQGIQGTVIIRFVVGPDGSIGNVEILRRSIDPSLDKEAVRVIKKMQNWIPGKQNGNPVSVYYTLPVRFKLQQN